MHTEMFSQLMSLGFMILFSLLIWAYYRNRFFAPSDRYSTFGPRFWTGFADSCVLWPVSFLTLLLMSLHDFIAGTVVVRTNINN